MKQLIKFFISAIVCISLQGVYAQDNNALTLFNDVTNAMTISEYDIVVRLDKEMNDTEMESLSEILRSFVADIEISYTRDESGNIKSLTSSRGSSIGYCASDDFDFLIIAIKDNEWKGCKIFDRSQI